MNVTWFCYRISLPDVPLVCWGGLERIKPVLPQLVSACQCKALDLCSTASLADGANWLFLLKQHQQHSWKAFTSLVVLLWCFPLLPICQLQRPSHILLVLIRRISQAPSLSLHQGLNCRIFVYFENPLGTEKRFMQNKQSHLSSGC